MTQHLVTLPERQTQKEKTCNCVCMTFRRTLCELWYKIIQKACECVFPNAVEHGGGSEKRNVEVCSLFSWQVLMLLWTSAYAWLHMIS